jgi:hypothetical protein
MILKKISIGQWPFFGVCYISRKIIGKDHLKVKSTELKLLPVFRLVPWDVRITVPVRLVPCFL